jgi:acyl-CoA thioester hydrolase
MTELDGEIRGGHHRMAVRVYYEDTDFSGVVYHASYLRFMERGRTNYLRLIGADHASLFTAGPSGEAGLAFVVRTMRIEFRRPARMDDVLTITTAAREVRGASILLRQEVLRGEEALVEAEVRVACASGGRPQPIPKPLRLAMAPPVTKP